MTTARLIQQTQRPLLVLTNSASYQSRTSGAVVRLLILLAVSLVVTPPVTCQSDSRTEPGSLLCSRDNALEIILQQAAATKTIDDSAQRVSILIRAADLLWPFRQDQARITFTEAFDAAVRNFKEKGDEPKKEGLGLLTETPDQRYVVISAIAKHDATWARKLTLEMLKSDRLESQARTNSQLEADIRTADKLLEAAKALLSSDTNLAINLATFSLQYPASMRLTMFLYKFAEVDKPAADHFYETALTAYANKPMREFLYLVAYPFGFDDPDDMPFMGSYNVPTGFLPNESLKRTFVLTLLRRAQQARQVPLDQGDYYNGLPGVAHIVQVLTRIEPHLQHLPDLIAEVVQTRNDLLSTLAPDVQSIFLTPRVNRDAETIKTFDEQLEIAENEPKTERRDQMLAELILNNQEKESLDRILSTVDKIADSNLRAQLLEWTFFNASQQAIKDKRFDEAAAIGAKVQALDQRAYLYSEIARELLKTGSEVQAREVLDEIVSTAAKAPNTVVTARALLCAAYLYAKVDPNRSISVLGDAIRTINRIESPDFSRQYFFRKIEGKNFARYTAFRTPGFDPPTVFQELAKAAFDDAFAQTGNLTDKSLRALTTIAVADVCLLRSQQQKIRTKTKRD